MTLDRIVIDPNILSGKPVIRGTRLAVEFMVGLLAQGWSVEQVLDNYPELTREDVQACLNCTNESATHLRSREMSPMCNPSALCVLTALLFVTSTPAAEPLVLDLWPGKPPDETAAIG